jgi:hypothetical protein
LIIKVWNESKIIALIYATKLSTTGIQVEYAVILDEKMRGKGVYTEIISHLNKQYEIVSDEDSNNSAKEIYKKLGADYQRGRYVLKRGTVK